MGIDSFSYNHKDFGCIDVDITEAFNRSLGKEMIEVNIIYFKDDQEYFNSFYYPKEEKLTYKQLERKINSIIKKQFGN